MCVSYIKMSVKPFQFIIKKEKLFTNKIKKKEKKTGFFKKNIHSPSNINIICKQRAYLKLQVRKFKIYFTRSKLHMNKKILQTGTLYF